MQSRVRRLRARAAAAIGTGGVALVTLAIAVSAAGCSGGRGVESARLETLTGRVLDAPGGSPGATAPEVVVVGPDGQSAPVAVGPDGTFSVRDVPIVSRLLVRQEGGAERLYALNAPEGLAGGRASVTLYAEPIFATSDTPGTRVAPTPETAVAPAYLATPTEGTDVPCDVRQLPVGACSWAVTGTADPRIAEPASSYRAYLLARARIADPFPHDRWYVLRDQVVPEADGTFRRTSLIPPPVGQDGVFDLVLVISPEPPPASSLARPLYFYSPGEFPGVVYISPVRRGLRLTRFPPGP